MSESDSICIRSYVSPKIVVTDSRIHGRGMVATAPLAAGEVAFIKGGHILRKQEVWSRSTINSYLPIDDEFVIGAKRPDEEEGIKLYVNHSCDPTCGVRGEITFVTLRSIHPGEELTCDYAMIDNEDYHFHCTCKSVECRGVVTGFDWKRKELQAKYGRFYARYLLDKMRG